jgi:hypothetical protein
MQLSLRSQLAAGVAFAGAAAIAVTPVVQGTAAPGLQIDPAVALAVFNNPFSEILATGNQVINYLLNSGYSTDGSVNWPYADIGTAINNGLLPIGYNSEDGTFGPRITAVGLIPNLVQVPLPILTQLAANAIGYANIALQTGGEVAQALANIGWAPIGLGIEIVTDLLTGYFEDIPGAITDTVTFVVDNVTAGFNAAIDGVTEILNTVVAKVSAVVVTLADAAPQLFEAVVAQARVLAAGVGATVEAIGAALAAGDLEATWNTALSGLLGPEGIPGLINNLTLGAGVQVSPDPTTFVPSIRTVVQTTGQALSYALKAVPEPEPNPTVAASAAAVEAPAAEADARTAPQPAAGPPVAANGRKAARAAAATDSSPQASADSGSSDKKSAPRASRKATSE